MSEDIEFTFNKDKKIKKRPLLHEPQPINITQVLKEKLEKRAEERCKVCGSLKERQSQRLNEDGAKYRMVCMNCKRRKRNETNKLKRKQQ